MNSDLLLYAVTRRAYKNGGFTINFPKVGFYETGGDAYRAERVYDVEIGSKFQGRIGNVPTRLSLAAYHIWISNNQRSAYGLELTGNPAALSVNVPKAKTYGLELESQINPASWLSLGGTFNYTRARFTNGQIIVFGAPTIFDRVPDTPKISGTIYGDMKHPVSSTLNAVFHADLYGQSKAFTGPQSTNFAGTTIPGYRLASFRLGVEDSEGGWSLTAILKNAFNRTYYTGGFAIGQITQINTLNPGDPRTISVEARLKF